MKISRREAIKLGLAGSGVLLSPLGSPDSAQAAETCNTKSCNQEPQPPDTRTPQPSTQVIPFQQPLYIPKPLKSLLSPKHPVKIFEEEEIKRQCPTDKLGATDKFVLATKQIEQTFDYYEIKMRKQPLPLSSDKDGKPLITAEFWTYQGTGAEPWITGPLIRQPKNRASCIRFINELGEDAERKEICTSVHLHGMASLPQYDGYSEDLIPCQHYKDYYYPNNRASTLWYHDHAVHKTSRNVYMGLAGMYIVEYDKDDFCDPSDFGCLPKNEFEIPLIIQDKSFEKISDREWKLVFNNRQEHGVYADLILVNGVPFPYLKVQRRKYYFRVLNASASRTYQLTLSGDPIRQTTDRDRLTKDNQPVQMTVIGTDAGLLAKPEHLIAPKQPLRIGIAERYGVIIDFSVFRPDVKEVYLRNLVFPGNLGSHASTMMRFELEDGEVPDPSYIPEALGKLTLKAEMDQRKVQTRTFRFGRGGQWMINGKTWSPARVDADPGQCSIEVWNLVNTGGWTHPVHIHLIDFQILKRNGQDPLPYEKGWKDVVVLGDLQTVQVVARFGPHRGKYMMHCHNIVHEDHDMMNQFEIGQGGYSPLSAPAKPLSEITPLGAAPPVPLIEERLPCKCFDAV